jgi:adenosylcobalamin-dependent ribonucleoside-triphosphate reductase
MKPSIRAEIVTRRTYNRPIDYDNTIFESWDETIDRVISHQKWLWERALTHKILPDMPLHDITEDILEWVYLDHEQEFELEILREIFLNREALPSGRTLWLGGTDVSKTREASQFNCAHTEIETVYDFVDIFWLLLQGCGVGFTPKVGTLTGFRRSIPKIEVIRSKRTGKGGRETNDESFTNGVWTISVGDSAESWAKSIGKLLAGKYKAHTLVFDFSQIRPEGERLKGYGWISSGDGPVSRAYPAIAGILNKRAGAILTKIDIIEITNWLGTVLSSRRSAEIALVEYGTDEWIEFAKMKENCYVEGQKHKQQSNNSLVFYHKPTKKQLSDVFDMIIKHGGSEPGIINGETAKKRAPWFSGLNPCAEILLGNKSFCNLVEIDIAKFANNTARLFNITPYVARANYRQTCVDFRDGVLQEAWHLNNEFLRLCGASCTGIAKRDDITEYEWKSLNRVANQSACEMAKELGTQRPKNVSTVKPSGTLSKVMDTWEGIHKPLGRYIFNWINFSQKDPLVEKLQKAGYKWLLHPSEKEGILICFPVDNGNHFDKVEVKRNDGSTEVIEINSESALTQLERYKKIQMYYCDQNVSNTISYDQSEKNDIVDWLLANWDIYVGVSFMFRNDPTLSAKDLGYEYLPQEVVTKDRYDNYLKEIKEIDFLNTETFEELEEDGCAGGICPVK